MWRAGAIVLGLTVNGLGVIRSLAAHGIPLIGIYQDQDEIGRLSRYCRDTIKMKLSGSNPTDLIATCQEVASRWSGQAVIYPTSDDFVEALSDAADVIAPLYLAVGPKPTLKGILDKQRFSKLVSRAGNSSPLTTQVSTLQAMLQFMKQCEGTALVKPRVSHQGSATLGCKVAHFSSAVQAKAIWRIIRNRPQDFILQEAIPDSSTGIAVYLGYRSRDGSRVFGCTGRKIRQLPVEGGTASCIRLQSIPGLAKTAQEFLRSIDYRGVFGLEYKWHPRHKRFYLLDMSARTELFHTVAWRGGLNLPYLCYLDCVNEVDCGVLRSRPACWIRVEHEVAAIKRLLGRGERLGQLLSRYRGRLCLPVFSLKDPLPFFGYCAQFAQRVKRKLTYANKATTSHQISRPLQDVLRGIISTTGAPAVLRWHRQVDSVLVTYHGVVSDGDWQDWQTADMVAQSVFRQHLDFYAKHYTVVKIKTICKCLQDGKPLPSRSLAITFDDGYRNNLRYAVPALKEYGLSATFFVTTGFLDRSVDLWWLPLKRCIIKAHREGRAFHLPGFGELAVRTYEDAGESYRRALGLLKGLEADDRASRLKELEETFPEAAEVLPGVYDPLTWEEARQLVDEGMEVGAHTVTHPILTQQSDKRARAEVFESVQRIRDKLGVKEMAFSYPNGQREDFTKDTEALAREAGCYAAVAGFPGFNRSADHLYQLRRFPIGGHHTVEAVELDLCGLRHSAKPFLSLFSRRFRNGG